MSVGSSFFYCSLQLYWHFLVFRSPQCDICDNTVGKRHPIEFAVDGSNQWWQSPTLAKGMKYEWVTITIDLRQVISYILYVMNSIEMWKKLIMKNNLNNMYAD